MTSESAAPLRRLPLSEQKRQLDEIDKLHAKPIAGEKWFAINTIWWQNWLDLTSKSKTDLKNSGSEVENVGDVELGKIDNVQIYDEILDGLKADMQEEVDYVLKPEEAWKKLVEWYGGSPAIEGEVVLNSNNVPTIDLYPARFRVIIEKQTDSRRAAASGSVTTSAADADVESYAPSSNSADRRISHGRVQVDEEEGHDSVTASSTATKLMRGKKGTNAKSPKNKDKDNKKAAVTTDSSLSEDSKDKAKGANNATEKLAKEGKLVLSISRHSKMKEIKPLVAKLLKKDQRALKLSTKTLENDDETFRAGYDHYDETDDKGMNQTIGEALPKVGLSLWELKVEIFEVDEKRLSVMRRFNAENPQIGQRVDARKDSETWCEGVIIDVIPTTKKEARQLGFGLGTFDDADDLLPEFDRKPQSANTRLMRTTDRSTDKDKEGKQETGDSKEKSDKMVLVKVHYLSFEEKDDELFDAGSKYLLPAYTKCPDWRTQLRVGEKVDINKKVFTNSTGWIEGEVKKIDRTGTQLKRFSTESGRSEDSVSAMSTLMTKIKKVFPGRGKAKKGNSNGSTTESVNKDDSSGSIGISEHGLVMVRVIVPGNTTWMRTQKDIVIDLGSEDIAAENTHVQKPKRSPYSYIKNSESKPEGHGLVGLRNLGNTCYMNSSLQCLFATHIITDYFQSGAYKKDLNRRNPLGFGGKIASSYGKLIEEVFSDKYSSVAPSAFKNIIGNSFQNFQGYGQQDTHEFISLLIDGLHEDLNRVKNKPYVEAIEANGRPEGIIAKLEWDNFLQRNQSVFVDHLYGQLKSHLTCPVCGNEATKFDAFSTWVVPLPIKDVLYVRVIFLSLTTKLVKLEEKDKLEVHSIVDKATSREDHIERTNGIRFIYEASGTLKCLEVAKFIAKKTNTRIENLLITDLKNNKPEKVLFDPCSKNFTTLDLSLRSELEIAVYELEPLDSDAQSDSSADEAQAHENSDINNDKIGLNTDLKTDKLKGGSAEGDISAEVEKSKQEKPESRIDPQDGFLNSDFGPKYGLTNHEIDELVRVPGKGSPLGSIKQPKGRTSSESSGSESDNIAYLAVHYKTDTSYLLRPLRMSDFLRLDLTKIRNCDVYAKMWRRCKFIFKYDEILAQREEDLKSGKVKEPKTGLDPSVMSPAEVLTMKDLFRLSYVRKELECDETRFEMASSEFWGSDYLDIKLSRKGMSNLAPAIKPEAPRSYSYYAETLENSNKNLNIGFVALDQSVHDMVTTTSKNLTLYDCLEAFRTPEKLGKEDEWYCGKCQAHVQATKKMDIYMTGDILVIALKRFKGERFRREKLTHLVDFPVEGLDLGPYVVDTTQKETLFDLYAVSYHMGGMGGGHYTAKVKGIDGEWYDMNDSMVRKSSGESVVSEQAYVLYYERRPLNDSSNRISGEVNNRTGADQMTNTLSV